MSCSFDGCDRPVEKGELCAGHRKQRVRREVLRPLRERRHRRPPRGVERRHRRNPESDRLERAALALGNAETDQEYERALRNLHDAALWYGTGMRKSPLVTQKFLEIRQALRALKVNVDD